MWYRRGSLKLAVVTSALRDADPEEFIRLAARVAGASLVAFAGCTKAQGTSFASWLEVHAFLRLELERERIRERMN